MGALLTFIVYLIIFGIIWWALNAIAGPYIHPPILRIINVIITVIVVIYALLFLLSMVGGFHLPQLR